MHLSGCSECRSVLAEAASLFTSLEITHVADESCDTSESRARELSPGTRVSRYVIAAVIGSGAAGIVYRAYDPELKRYVALKLLRAEQAGEDSLRARLLREAQAMAQLSHPNVVSVFDVGTFGQEVFIVLELVHGSTLAAWLEEPRPWHLILSAFLEAGKGLAAAHAVKLVHRDFKPANVLVSVDGRVRVTDFGLARALRFGQEAEIAPVTGLDASTAPLLSGTLTRTGEIAGTPIYMAPEQFASEPADERSDQFAFCVALYAALYRSHPYLALSSRRPSLADLMAALERGELRTPKHGAVPAAVFRFLRRGLALDPAKRFASMQQLLDELASALRDTATHAAPWRRPLRTTAIATAFVGSVAAALSFSWWTRETHRLQHETVAPKAAIQSERVEPTVFESEPPSRAAPEPTPSAVVASVANRGAGLESLKKNRVKRGNRAPSRSRVPQAQSSSPPTPSPAAGGGLKQYNDALKDPF
jgi:serine/threonine protein kinase